MVNNSDKTISLVTNYYLPEEDNEALNRAEIIFRTINKILPINNDYKILDIGFGGGYLLKKFLGLVPPDNLFGVDISEKCFEHVDFAPLNNFYIADAQKDMDMFMDNCFDLLISTDVVEHIFDPVSFYNNLLKKTKIGGYILLNIPLELNLRNRLNILFGKNIHNPFIVGGHIRFFKPDDLIFFDNKETTVVKLEYDQWFGNPDSFKRKMGIRKWLANFWPNMFAGRVVILIKKNS